MMPSQMMPPSMLLNPLPSAVVSPPGRVAARGARNLARDGRARARRRPCSQTRRAGAPVPMPGAVSVGFTAPARPAKNAAAPPISRASAA